MNVSDGFFLGMAFAAAVGSLLASIAQKVATRVHAAHERERLDREVRLAFVKLAGQMREGERRHPRKHDMPWTDRMKEAQAGQVVMFGIAVPRVAAT